MIRNPYLDALAGLRRNTYEPTSSEFFKGLLGSTLAPTKPRVFVSYHHRNDQYYADWFTTLFDRTYSVVTDRSLDAGLDSDDAEYIYQRIRDEFISGTSCTIVLCGAETPNRNTLIGKSRRRSTSNMDCLRSSYPQTSGSSSPIDFMTIVEMDMLTGSDGPTTRRR